MDSVNVAATDPVISDLVKVCKSATRIGNVKNVCAAFVQSCNQKINAVIVVLNGVVDGRKQLRLLGQARKISSVKTGFRNTSRAKYVRLDLCISA